MLLLLDSLVDLRTDILVIALLITLVVIRRVYTAKSLSRSEFG